MTLHLETGNLRSRITMVKYETHHLQPLTQNKGFTLLEVLLAATLSSIILATLYSTFFMSTKVADEMDGYIIRLQEAREMMDSIRREIESSFYREKDDNTGFKVMDRDEFGRQTSSIYFTTFSGAGRGIKHIGYYVKKRDEKLILFKKIESVLKKKQPIEIEIIEDIEEFSIEVQDRNRSIKTWDTTWTKKMPQSIKVRIMLSIGNEEITLYETVDPKISREVV